MPGLIAMMDGMITDARGVAGPRFAHPEASQEACGLWVAAWGRQLKRPVQDDVRARRLGSHAVVLLEAGRGWFEQEGGTRRTIAAPCLLWLFPGLAHGYGAERGWRERWLLFAGPVATALQHAGALSSERPVTPLTADHPLRAAFLATWDRQRRSEHLAASGELLRLLTALSLSGPGDQPATGDELVDRACLWLRDHRDREVCPAGLARALAVSYPTLRRRFRSATGLSVKGWHARRRMEYACELLLGDPQRPINRIAERCGFADPYHFSRRFRSVVGIDPSGFRARGCP